MKTPEDLRSDETKFWHSQIEKAVTGERERCAENALDTRHFDEGVTHTVKLLAKALGITDWDEGDGSEDYDCDLTTTLMNILEAKGLYSSEDGAWARLRPTLALVAEQSAKEPRT